MTDAPKTVKIAVPGGMSEIARRFGGFVPQPCIVASKPDLGALKAAVAAVPAKKPAPLSGPTKAGAQIAKKPASKAKKPNKTKARAVAPKTSRKTAK